MPAQCCVGNKGTLKDDVSHHYFPKDSSVRAKWVKSVSNTRKDFKGPGTVNSLVVCSDHFKEECFTSTYRMKKALGLDYKTYKPKMEKDAVPTLFNISDVPETTPIRSAVRKREIARILEENINHRPAESTPLPVPDLPPPASPDNSDASETFDQPMPTPVIPPATRPSIPLAKPARKHKRSKGVQATEPTRTTETQFLRKHMVRMVNKGTQYNPSDIEKPTPSMIRYPTKYQPIEQPGTEQPPVIITSTPRKQPPPKPDVLSPLSHNTSIDTVSDKDTDVTVSMYAPSECSTDHDGDSFTTVKSPKDANKLIVFEYELLKLFTICRRCLMCTTARVTQRMGTFVSILQECSCGYDFKWNSQPFVGDIPCGNLLLSASVLFSGSQPTKVLHVFSHMNVQCYAINTFFTHQRHFLLPAVESVWNTSTGFMREAIRKRGGGMCLAGDGRSDSPGHSAKYGSYTVMDLDAGKVLDIKLVQSNEVKGGSVNMEKEGLIRVVDELHRENLDIKLLVTDRHVQIQKWVRENLTDTEHCYDVWHIAKAVKKKLTAIAKTKECEDVGHWVKSISNHLYWCAASSEDGDMIASKWKSVANHIQNIHSGHEGPFSACQHGDIGPKKWLKPSTKAACQVEDYVVGTRLCNDIRKMSTQHQTSDLESYHSVVNHFAPKLYSFDFNPQLGRMKVAALHFNENTERAQALTKGGDVRTQVIFPKFKKGEYTIKIVKEDPTYKYVSTLMEDVVSRGREKITQSQLLKTPVPPPLCSTRKRPTKTDVTETLCRMTTRYKKKMSLFE